MEYTIKPENRFQKTLKKFQSAAEDRFLSIVLFLTKVTKSEKLSAWIEKYTEKKMQQLQQEIIRMKWNQETLKKATIAIQKK